MLKQLSLTQVGWKSDVGREEVAFLSGATDIEAETTGYCRTDDDTTVVHARTNGKGRSRRTRGAPEEEKEALAEGEEGTTAGPGLRYVIAGASALQSLALALARGHGHGDQILSQIALLKLGWPSVRRAWTGSPSTASAEIWSGAFARRWQAGRLAGWHGKAVKRDLETAEQLCPSLHALHLVHDLC
jgi:hypothetical protein